jgi:hypothetical protein
LEPEDILDVYGCQILLTKRLTDDEEAAVKARIYQIKDFYVNSAKARIRAEAGFCGIKDLKIGFSIQEILETVMAQLFDKKQEGSGPPNLMASILEAHKIAGTDLSGYNLGAFGVKQEAPKPKPGVDPRWFKKGSKEGGRLWDNPKWHEISKAYVTMEQAEEPQAIIQAIDRLNGLQHNSFHVLIDLQSGRMLDMETAEKDRKARNILKEVLDLKFKSKDPAEFADRMSEEIRKLLLKHKGE